MKKLISSAIISVSILAGNTEKGNCENIRDELINQNTITRTYNLSLDINSRVNNFVKRGILPVRLSEDRELLGMKIWEVNGKYNKQMADELASVGKEVRKIVPKNVFVKTSINEIKIGVKYEVESIIDYNFLFN